MLSEPATLDGNGDIGLSLGGFLEAWVGEDPGAPYMAVFCVLGSVLAVLALRNFRMREKELDMGVAQELFWAVVSGMIAVGLSRPWSGPAAFIVGVTSMGTFLVILGELQWKNKGERA